MSESEQSLQKIHPRHLDVPILLAVSLVLLWFGLFLPVITLKELVFWKHTFSVLSGISSLVDEGHYFLGIVIFLFSIVFPFIKLGMLFALWFGRLAQWQREKYIHWLGAIGKWSMLDVFVVAITIVIAKLSGFASAQPQIGLYFFGSSILLAMLVTVRIERLIAEEH